MRKKTAQQHTRWSKSTDVPGQPKNNPSGLPYGTGSLQIRGTSWWMIYRDPEGRVIQENCRTKDRGTALRMLLAEALATAQAKVAALEQMLDEAQEAAGTERDGSGSGAGAAGTEGCSGSGAVPAGSGTKKGKGTN